MASDAKNSPSFNMEPIYVILALIIIVISFLLTKKLRKTTNVILLVGLSDSGKTAIFTKLIFNKPKKSVTSLKENEATLNDLNLRLIDLPGAERLRPRYWEQYRDKARRVVVVVDSTTVESKLRDLSEYLYYLLSDSIIQKNKIQFTITCHKQDHKDAKKRDLIKSILEEEMTAIKETRKGQLGRTSEVESEDYLSSMFDGRISLDSLKVNFIESSIHNLDLLVQTINVS